VRGHWGIEDCIHWVLDIAFREDESRVRKGNAPENLSVLRHIASICYDKKDYQDGHSKQTPQGRMGQ
jgi:predicted transposase YbfD/YdcC